MIAFYFAIDFNDSTYEDNGATIDSEPSCGLASAQPLLTLLDFHSWKKVFISSTSCHGETFLLPFVFKFKEHSLTVKAGQKQKQMLMKGTSFFPFNSYLSNQGVRPLFSRGFEMLTKIFNSVHGWLTILCSRSPKSDIMTVRRRHCPLFSIHGLPKSASIHVKQLRNNKGKAQRRIFHVSKSSPSKDWQQQPTR